MRDFQQDWRRPAPAVTSGTRPDRYRCSLPGLAGFTAGRREGANAGHHMTNLAERVGFEPTYTLSDITGIPVQRLRPLGHLSRSITYYYLDDLQRSVPPQPAMGGGFYLISLAASPARGEAVPAWRPSSGLAAAPEPGSRQWYPARAAPPGRQHSDRAAPRARSAPECPAPAVVSGRVQATGIRSGCTFLAVASGPALSGMRWSELAAAGSSSSTAMRRPAIVLRMRSVIRPPPPATLRQRPAPPPRLHGVAATAASSGRRRRPRIMPMRSSAHLTGMGLASRNKVWCRPARRASSSAARASSRSQLPRPPSGS